VLWSVVKANVTAAGLESERALNEWWSHHHVPLYVAREGFHCAWRLRHVEHSASRGDAPQYYFAVYQIDSVEVFGQALAEEAWGPFEESVGKWITDWGRTYYRLLTEYEAKTGNGRFWAIVSADLIDSDEALLSEFNRWYDTKHVPEICSNDGFYRAWRLEVHRHEDEIGPAGERFWAVYEHDSPDDFARAIQRRTDAGIERWDGLWLSKLRTWNISFHEVIHKEVHGTGSPTGVSYTHERRARQM
jgi:hypothetical protein